MKTESFIGGKQLKDNMQLEGKIELQCTLLNVNRLELLVCLTKNCDHNFLGGEEVQASHSLEVLDSQKGIPKDRN